MRILHLYQCLYNYLVCWAGQSKCTHCTQNQTKLRQRSEQKKSHKENGVDEHVRGDVEEICEAWAF